MDEENKDNVKKEKIEIEKNFKKQNKQIRFAVILMISIIIIIIFVPFIIKNFFNTFEYDGLEFQKTRLGELIFYSAKIPVTNIQGNVIGDYSINLRKDPRELENIKVDVPDEIITFKREKTVYITLNPEMETCEDNLIAIAELAGFLANFGEMEVKGASIDKNYAKENKFPYVTCENHMDNTVIYINSGNETKIKKDGDCYEVTYNNCESLEVSEKFILEILRNYMSYFDKI